MTRAQQTISIAMLLTSVRRTPPCHVPLDPSNIIQLYLAVFMELVSFPEKIQKEVVPVVRKSLDNSRIQAKDVQLPFWALISFGAYLLFKLGWGVFTFNDVPDAHAELMSQIKEARADLRAQGVDVGADD